MLLFLLLALTGWEDPFLLNTNGTSDTGLDGGPRIILDHSGVFHAVWISTEDLNGTAGQDWDIFYAFDDGSGWNTPELLNINGNSDAGQDTSAGILCDSFGTLHAIWQSDENLNGTSGTDKDIFYASNNGSGWTFPILVNVNGNSDSRPDEAPRMIIDSYGTLHAVWFSYENLNGTAGLDADIFYATNSGSGWTAPIVLNTNGMTDSGGDYFPVIIEDASKTLHVVWCSEEDLGGVTGTDYDIFYASNSGTGWSAPALLNTNGTTDSGLDQSPWIIEDSMGNLHAVWDSMEDLGGTAGTDQDIFYAMNKGSGWSPPVLLNTNGQTDTGADSGVRILEDARGYLCAAWTSNEDLGGIAGTDQDILYAINTGTEWLTPSLLNVNGTADVGYDNSVELLLDYTGMLHAVWQSTENLNGTIGTDDDILTSTLMALPDEVWYTLIMPDTLLAPGETFVLISNSGNPYSDTIPVFEFVILDVYGAYWFWPGWSQNLDMWTGDLGPGGSWTVDILEFDWPSGAGTAQGLRFWGAFLHQGTLDLIAYDMIEWGFFEP